LASTPAAAAPRGGDCLTADAPGGKAGRAGHPPKIRPASVLTAALALLALVACGGGKGTPTPVPTPLPPAVRAATATASAEAALLAKSPCLVDPAIRTILRQVADLLWDLGSEVVDDGDATQGLRFYEASIAYGILTDCREVAGTPAAGASPEPVSAATPAACIGDPAAIQQLRDAAAKGTGIAFQAAFAGAVVEDLEPLFALNALLIQRADEIEVACGLRAPGTPSPVGTPGVVPVSTNERR
jgi:hypothetical protein